jgi:hypothetical protein
MSERYLILYRWIFLSLKIPRQSFFLKNTQFFSPRRFYLRVYPHNMQLFSLLRWWCWCLTPSSSPWPPAPTEHKRLARPHHSRRLLVDDAILAGGISVAWTIGAVSGGVPPVAKDEEVALIPSAETVFLWSYMNSNKEFC